VCEEVPSITVFHDSSSSKTVEYGAGGGSNSSVKIKVPLNFNASKAVVNMTGQPLFLTGEKQLDIILVNDVSGSMDNNCGPDGIAQPGELPCNINQLKISANEIVDTIPLEIIQMGLVSYSTAVVSSLTLTDDVTSLHNEINSYAAMDRTCISCGIDKGIELITDGTNPERHMILMSDGRANHCIGQACTQIVAKNEAIKKAKEAWEDFGIHVHTIAFTEDSDNKTMKEIAQVGNGTFHFAEEENLTDVFLAIAQEITRSDPSNTTMDLGTNGINEWTHPGLLLGTDHVSFLNELNAIDCSCPSCVISGSECIIDMELSSETAGKIIADELLIEGCVLTLLPLPTTTTTLPTTTTTLPEETTTTTTSTTTSTTSTTIPECTECADHLLISEVLYDPPAPEPDREWLELYNPTSSGINLAGYKLEDNIGSFSLPSEVIPTGSTIVIAHKATEFSSLYGFPPDVSGLTLLLSNSGDVLSLRAPNGTEIDMVAWEDGPNNILPDWNITANENQSIERFPIDQDTDTVADWRVSIPTPDVRGSCDADSDGFNSSACLGSDCNDANAGISPAATEICGNGIDENCDGTDASCPQPTAPSPSGGSGVTITDHITKPALPEVPVIISALSECREEWQCSEWSACIGSGQTRVCIDRNLCGTTKFIPIGERSCTEGVPATIPEETEPVILTGAELPPITALVIARNAISGFILTFGLIIIIYMLMRIRREREFRWSA